MQKVVNCFQFIIFAPAKTTDLPVSIFAFMLWIAFNLLFSPQRKQRFKTPLTQKSVVNCFQFIIFAPAKTTSALNETRNVLLWIAFNLLFSPQRKQHRGITHWNIWSCELLSIYYFRPSENNRYRRKPWRSCVVNCFQFIIFAPAKTTLCNHSFMLRVLWIAFNLLFSPQRKQLPKYIDTFIRVVNCFQFIIFAPAKTTKFVS